MPPPFIKGYQAPHRRARVFFRPSATLVGSQAEAPIALRYAQGNILSIYKKVGGGTLKQNTAFMYGSGRLGELIINRDSAVAWNRHYYRIKGNRHYELTNHLGNVLAVVTDRKLGQDTTVNATYTPQYYLPDIYSVQNYYAFGQNLPKWSSSALNDPKRYRFGFNGKEDDDEWTKQDYGFRMYDPRVARFLSVDPLAGFAPDWTPYRFGCLFRPNLTTRFAPNLTTLSCLSKRV